MRLIASSLEWFLDMIYTSRDMRKQMKERTFSDFFWFAALFSGAFFVLGFALGRL